MESKHKFWINILIGSVGILFIAALVLSKFGFFKFMNSANVFSLPTEFFGTDTNFLVLASQSIVSTGTSVVMGDIGVSYSAKINGFSSGTTLNDGPGTLMGTAHEGDQIVADAHTELNLAYNALVVAKDDRTGLATEEIGTMDLADHPNRTFSPGVYHTMSDMRFTNGTLTFDGGGDPTAAFIFQTARTLSIGPNTTIVLTNGATACNIFWQARGATIGTRANFKGNVLSLGHILANDNSVIEGRLLSTPGALEFSVTLNNATVINPSCTPAPSTGNVVVIKKVIGGPYDNSSKDFKMLVSVSPNSSQGPVITFEGSADGTPTEQLVAGTQFVVSEDAIVGYDPSYEGACTGVIEAGISKVCTVTNTFRVVDIGQGNCPVGFAQRPDGSCVSLGGDPNRVAIGLDKTVNVSSLTNGPGPVVYTYQVKNLEMFALQGVSLSDDKCSPTSYVSGDSNGDTKLDPTETWTYTCSATVYQTTLSTGTVMAFDAKGTKVNASDDVTVVVDNSVASYQSQQSQSQSGGGSQPQVSGSSGSVGSSVGIRIVKTPNPSLLPAGGGTATYAYAVTNPGAVALSNVSVTDNKCSPVSGPVGDSNANGKLEPSETWTYTCQMQLTRTTSNVARAQGTANGLAVSHEAFATVVVGTPTLPATGFAPRLQDAFAKPSLAVKKKNPESLWSFLFQVFR